MGGGKRTRRMNLVERKERYRGKERGETQGKNEGTRIPFVLFALIGRRRRGSRKFNQKFPTESGVILAHCFFSFSLCNLELINV